MALLKSSPTRAGVPAAYWNIVSTSTDYAQQVIKVQLLGWFSEEARRAEGAQALAELKLELKGSAFVPDADRADIYRVLLASNHFAGAESN